MGIGTVHDVSRELDHAVSVIVGLSPAELARLAKLLVVADAVQADRLIDALIDSFEIAPRR